MPDLIPPDIRAGIAAGTNTVDLAPFLQAEIDAAAGLGGTVDLPAGRLRIETPLAMRSGVSLRGQGRHGNFDVGYELRGSWLEFHGAPACLSLHDCQHVDISDIGIICDPAAKQTAIFIGSNNAPAVKSLTFSRFMIVNADVGIKWGNANAETAEEQCDDISISEGYFLACGDGIVMDAVNVGDYSKIERCTFYSVIRTAVSMKRSAFMEISKCAAGMLPGSDAMFKLSGCGPDPVIIELCQSEGSGKFLTYNPGANDQGAIHLDRNVVNQPIEVNGIARVTSQGNFINSTIATTGFVRWRSRDDVWDGVYGQPLYAPQTKIAAPGQFSAYGLKNAVSYMGHHLPMNFHIENGEAVPGGYQGVVVTRAGVRCATFIPANQFAVGDTVQPTTDNGHAYQVAVAGAAGAEPKWPTAAGATVTSGRATFREIGANAILKGYGAIQA